MKTSKSIAAVVLFAAAGVTFAQERFVAPDAGFVSTLTRAEVVAEINPAFVHGEQNYIETVAAGTRTRAEVRSEAVAANKDSRKVASGVFYGLGAV
ncbi:MAG: DUF4148 domain-containing protein [Pseudomonadota bacterium]